jgi:hypothetical protein
MGTDQGAARVNGTGRAGKVPVGSGASGKNSLRHHRGPVGGPGPAAAGAGRRRREYPAESIPAAPPDRNDPSGRSERGQ